LKSKKVYCTLFYHTQGGPVFSRRDFLKTSGLLSLAPLAKVSASVPPPAPRPLIKPPALKKGDTIGLVTPASPLFEAHRLLIEVTEKMHNLGFKTKPGKNIFKRYGYLAGTVQDRIDDLHAMFADPEVKAIIAIRGGYGSAQLLPHLDYELIKKNPKILMGYSDITSLLLGIHAQTGLVTFHGPVAESTFTDYTRSNMQHALMSTDAPWTVPDAPYEANLQTSNRIWAYRGGVSTGRLLGGNMTLFTSLLGTPYEVDTSDAILFFEEVGEEPYDLDRMLNHMKMAGKFDRCKGVIFDKMPSVKPADYEPAFYRNLSVEQVIEDVFKDFDFPVCIGFSLGHIKNKPTMPMGIHVKLDGDKRQITFLEAAVR